MLERFGEVIDSIYSAATDQSRWRDALAGVEELTGSAGAVINVITKDDPRKSFVLNGPRLDNHFSVEAIDEYNRDLLPHCPRVAAGIANPNLPLVCDYMLLSEAEMDRNVAYDWYGRHGLRYFIGAPIGETDRYKLMWSVQRTPAQGHAEDADLQLFELLKPHIARAVVLADELGTLRNRERFSSAVIEALPYAVFALDSDGLLLFSNSAGQKLLSGADGLVVDGGRLRTADPRDQSRLDAIIRNAIVPLGSRSSFWTRISRPSGKLPLAVSVAPLNSEANEFAAINAKALVIVDTADEQRHVSIEVLISVYGLTEAEARLASAVAGGHSIESAAVLLGSQQSTVRTQLKSIFRKLGVSRQQDLVRLLTSLAMMPVVPL